MNTPLQIIDKSEFVRKRIHQMERGPVHEHEARASSGDPIYYIGSATPQSGDYGIYTQNGEQSHVLQIT